VILYSVQCYCIALDRQKRSRWTEKEKCQSDLFHFIAAVAEHLANDLQCFMALGWRRMKVAEQQILYDDSETRIRSHVIEAGHEKKQSPKHKKNIRKHATTNCNNQHKNLKNSNEMHQLLNYTDNNSDNLNGSLRQFCIAL